PCPDSVYRIDWQVPPDFDLTSEERSGRLDSRIRSIVGHTPYEIVWHSVYRFHTRVAERMRVGRVLLAGDNAHLVAPFGARGPHSVYGIDWQVPPDFDLTSEESSGRLDSRIRSIVGHTPYEIVWHSVYRFHTRVAERMRVGRVLLAGDNAHLVAPFGARGLNSGVQDAENAAWKLAYVRNGWADEELLESYHTERHAAALENAEVTGATMRFLVPQCHEEHRMRRATLDRAVTDPTA